MRRVIDIDIHRTFGVVVIWKNGLTRQERADYPRAAHPQPDNLAMPNVETSLDLDQGVLCHFCPWSQVSDLRRCAAKSMMCRRWLHGLLRHRDRQELDHLKDFVFP